MTYRQLVAYYGTASEAARKLRVNKATVSLWQKGIPLGRQYIIQAATRGRLRARA